MHPNSNDTGLTDDEEMLLEIGLGYDVNDILHKTVNHKYVPAALTGWLWIGNAVGEAATEVIADFMFERKMLPCINLKAIEFPEIDHLWAVYLYVADVTWLT